MNLRVPRKMWSVLSSWATLNFPRITVLWRWLHGGNGDMNWVQKCVHLVQVEYLFPQQRHISGNQWDEKVKVKCSCYRPGVAQRVGRVIALLFHDRGIRRWWVVSSTLRPQFTPGKNPVPILQEAGWAPGPVWMGGKCRPHRDSMLDLPARSSVAIPTELPGPQISEIAH